MEFNIGERVKIRDYYDMPEEARSKGIAKVAGEEGEIVDKLYSEKQGCTVYRIHLDGYDRPSKCDFTEGTFDLIERDEAQYTYEFEYLENLVVARLYEIDGDTKKFIAQGHGHIFHDGAYGIAQAASYALKRICEQLGGGSIKSYKNN